MGLERALFDGNRVYEPNDNSKKQELVGSVLKPTSDNDRLTNVVHRLAENGYTIVPLNKQDFSAKVSGGRVIFAYDDGFVFEVITSAHWRTLEHSHVTGEQFTYIISDRVGADRDWKIKPFKQGSEQGDALDCTVRVAYLPLPELEKPKESSK